MHYSKAHTGKQVHGMNHSPWRQRVLLIFSVALLIRVAFVLTLQNGFYFADSVDYSAAAVNLIAHGEIPETYRRAPLYPIFLAGVYGLFGQGITTVRIVESVLGACLAVVIALLAKRMLGEPVGVLAGLLWSIYPAAVFIVGLVYPTNITTLLLACALLCITTKTAQEPTQGRVILGGFSYGLVALAVPVALLTVGATALWLAYCLPRRRLLTLLFLLGATLALAPWTIRNLNVHGRFVPVEPRLVESLPWLAATREDGTPYQSDEKIQAIWDNTDMYATRVLREFWYFWELSPNRLKMNRPWLREKLHEQDARIVKETVYGKSWTSIISIISVGPMFLFAVTGTVIMSLNKELRHHLSLLCLTVLSFALGYSFFWGKMRYRIPVEPYLMILAAYALCQTWSVFVSRRTSAVSPDEPQLAPGAITSGDRSL
jgi:4-amino-4-deoxy-L-arabinose transferase-like glycosyltransferase